MHRKNDRTNLVAIESLESRRLLSVNTSCEIRNAVTSDSLSGSGLYEADLPATRDQGDWNGDQRFDSSDFVYAYTKGVTSMGKGILDCQATFLQSDVVDQAFEAVDDGPVLEQRRQDIQLATAAVYSVVDLSFDGPNQTPMDTPSREIDFDVTFRHEDGTEHKVLGFWDGDGAGGEVRQRLVSENSSRNWVDLAVGDGGEYGLYQATRQGERLS